MKSHSKIYVLQDFLADRILE